MQNRSSYLILPIPSPNGLLMSGYRVGFGVSAVHKARLISFSTDMAYISYFNPKPFFNLRVSVFKGEKDGKGSETGGFEQALGKSTVLPPCQCISKIKICTSSTRGEM